MKNPNSSEADKNIMPNPAGSEVLQNVVVNPQVSQATLDPQALNRQVQDNQVLQLVVNPVFQMTAAESIGINNIVNDFLRIYQNNFAPQINQFQGNQGLVRATFLICREIDSMRMIGNSYNMIMASESLVRRIATSGSYGMLHASGNIVPFDNFPFETKTYLINLTLFIVRYLNTSAVQV